jgi:outer membrane lipoprotein-sorting protein
MTSTKAKRGRLVKVRFVVCLFLLGIQVKVSAAQETSLAAPLTADQVVKKMVASNERRALALESYKATRAYHLEYHGLTDKSADLIVTVMYRRPNEERFTIVSESGSALLNKRVLERLLQAELESMREENRRRTAIRPENYGFLLVDHERTSEHDFYVLEITPRTKNEFQFRGRIWVEGTDFAVARIEGEPAKNPSWWTRRNVVRVTYEKHGDFWLPARNETTTQVRIAGRSLLTIEYRDYHILETGDVRLAPLPEESSAASQESARLTGARP